MRVLRAAASTRPQVPGVPGRRWGDFHLARRELDERRCQGIESAADDGVRADVRPVRVGVLKELRKPVENRAELLPPADEPARELRDRRRIALADIFSVEHAGGVERDVVTMLKGNVAVCRLGVRAAGLHHLPEHLRVDQGGPRRNFAGELLTKCHIAGIVWRSVVAPPNEVVYDVLKVPAKFFGIYLI